MVLKSVWSSAFFWKVKLVVVNWITKCEQAMPLKWDFFHKLSIVIDITYKLTHYFYLLFWTACYNSHDLNKRYKFEFCSKIRKRSRLYCNCWHIWHIKTFRTSQAGASVCFVLKHHTIKKTENYTMYWMQCRAYHTSVNIGPLKVILSSIMKTNCCSPAGLKKRHYLFSGVAYL